MTVILNMINYDDRFFSDLSDLLEDLELDIDNLPKDYTIECEECTLEPIFKLDSDKMMDELEGLYGERMSEDGDEYDDIQKVFDENIDFDLINSKLPKLWYPNGKEIIFTYDDIIKELN
jgi:hypothetical protein